MLKKLVFITTTILAGCNLPYQPPEQGDTAMIRFYAPETDAFESEVGVYTHSDDQCGGTKKVRSLGAALKLGGISDDMVDLGMLKNSNHEYEMDKFVEILVPSNEIFNFSMIGSSKYGVCRMTMSFIPEKNMQYEIGYRASLSRCYATIERIDDGEGVIHKSGVKNAKVNERTCTFFWN